MKHLFRTFLLASTCLFISLSAMADKLTLSQTQSMPHCNNPEYLQLEDSFIELESAKKAHFFVLDKRCMLELGLDKDEIIERRTIFLMGSMNYEHYGVIE